MTDSRSDQVRTITVPGGRNDVADWDVVIDDDEPDIYVNAKAVAAIVRTSPLGQEEALARLRAAMPEDYFAAIERELR